MNLAWIILITVPALLLAYHFYGRLVARWLGEDRSCPTPAILFRDDKDFVPTRPSVLFGHHFATIAGAGPILGPTMAAVYGYGPVWLWILAGGILFGAVHDYAALSISLREGGRSMADVARKVLGRPGFVLFVLFTILMLVLVTASFLRAAAISLTSEYPLGELGVTLEDTYLKTRIVGGVAMGRIGGIASTSVILITALAPLVGYLIYKRNLATWLAYLLTGLIAAGSIVVGFQMPLSIDPTLWMVILTAYVWLASSVPVWILLQPRDFTNVQILYGGIALLVVAILAAGLLHGAAFTEPAFSTAQLAQGDAAAGGVWPMIFVLVACGAISGFHCLVSGGTTSKQCWFIRHARPIAFGGMLLESLLAACVLAVVVWGLPFDKYRELAWPALSTTPCNPVLAFAIGCARLFHTGLGLPVGVGSIFGILMVEGFVVTTLDSAVRLNRYLFEELWNTLWGGRAPRLMRHALLNSALAVALMFLMGYFNAFQKIWPAFGAANQLLAALALLVISLWLLARRRQAWFTLVPALFMTVTTIAALLWLFFTDYRPHGNVALMITDGLMLLLAAAMIALAAVNLVRHRRSVAPDADAAA